MRYLKLKGSNLVFFLPAKRLINICLLIFVCFGTSDLLAVNCALPSIELNTQDQVDNFKATYDDEGACDTISIDYELMIGPGDINNLDGLTSLVGVRTLKIQFTSLLTNLDGLSELTDLEALYLHRNSALTNTDGLGSVAGIVYTISILDNESLIRLGGFTSVSQATGDILIRENPQLQSITGLNSLTEITGELQVYGSPNLENINGLSNLTELGGGLALTGTHSLKDIYGLSALTRVGGWFNLGGHTALENIDGLSALTHVGGYLTIRENHALTRINTLNSLEFVGGDFTVTENNSLETISDFHSLSAVGGGLGIKWNNVLSSVKGFNALTSVGGVSIRGESLVELSGFSNLTNITGSLGLGGYLLLTEIDAFKNLLNVDNYVDISETSLITSLPFSKLTRVGGYLSLVENASLTNIDALSFMTEVGEDLRIQNNVLLQNINGLSAVSSVGSSLLILWNNLITNVDSLSSLVSVGSGLAINSQALTNLDGLSKLESIGDYFSIGDCDSLSNLDGLPNLTHVGGNFFISQNDAVSSIDGFPKLTSIGGRLSIDSNDGLVRINGLTALTTVGGDMEISNNGLVSELNGFQSLTSVGAFFAVHDNQALERLDNFSNLTSVGGGVIISRLGISDMDGLSGLSSIPEDLDIQNNIHLTQINALSNVNEVGGSVIISNNPQLTSVTGLSSLTSIGDALTLQDNDLLANLDGFDSLITIGGEGDFAFLQVYNNKSLLNINGLRSLVSIEGDAGIGDNDELTNVNGFSALQSVEGSFHIVRNASIENVDGLVSLAQVGGGMGISDNESLTNVNGLSTLSKIGDSLVVSSNAVLTNLNGLSSLVSVGYNVDISLNSHLNKCYGLIQLVDDVDDAEPGPGPGTTGIPDIGGFANLQNNLTGCNSVEQVLASGIDDDNDGIPWDDDNCPDIANPDQADTDGDGIGDLCDSQPNDDSDGDGVLDGQDNCPNTPNPDQRDIDNNGIGDACEQVILKDQQSQVVKVFVGPGGPYRECRGIAEVNGEILAQIDVDVYGCELWRLESDGQHELLADLREGEVGAGISYNFGYYAPYDGWIYFGVEEGYLNKRMWRTDGYNVEQVTETVPEPDGFSSIPDDKADFLGRYYFMANTIHNLSGYYSTDGLSMRPEPEFPLADNGRVDGVHTLFDKLIVTLVDDTHGREPWVFDGDGYRILEDMVPGPGSSLLLGDRWLYFDESYVFNAQVLNESEQYEPSFFFTDGETISRIPHSGPWRDLNSRGGYVHTREAQFAVDIYEPGSGTTGIPVQRISKEASSAYELPTDLAVSSLWTSAVVLHNDALVLDNNHLFKLGESSAQELSFNLPSDWVNSNFRFVGSGEYFSHAYIKEVSEEGDSRIWAWNHSEAGLLMADDAHVVTNADYFRHVGNDIYFYGEDGLVGMALRKIPDAVIKPVPRLGAVTGSWYDPATAGQGFVLHPVDDKTTVISFYGFEDNGKPLWLTGVSTDLLETGYTTEINMNITSGGNFGSFTPGQISEEPWGTLRLTFDTCSKATAEFDGLSGQQTMSMVRLASLEGMECFYFQSPPEPESSGLTGSWFDPATSGQGFVLHPMSDGQMIVSFYGYKDSSERLWLVGNYIGQITKGEPLVIDMLAASGGSFGGFTPDDITETKWGTLTINFDDCKNATATLNGIDGQQTMNMVKLAGLQGSELNCQ